jgi:CMP-N-acetylneuraminic acid synthetase
VRILGVIPARGGSKGVPRKNIRDLGGRPLIAYTIDAAAASTRLTRTVLSTDDDEIAAIAESLGADVPFRRPAELASDTANAVDHMQFALHAMEDMEGEPYDAVMMLQPTTPFRAAEDIDGAVALLEATGADSVISVADVGGHHPARMKYLDGDRLVDPPFCEEHENQNRQELPPMYIRNGALYLTRRPIMVAGGFKGDDCRAWIMPAERSVNIDTIADFEYAQWRLAAGDASVR